MRTTLTLPPMGVGGAVLKNPITFYCGYHYEKIPTKNLTPSPSTSGLALVLMGTPL